MKRENIIKDVFMTILYSCLIKRERVRYAWSKYELGYQKCLSNHGKAHTLKLYKSSHAFLRDLILELTPTPVEQCRVDKNGIPRTLWPLRGLIQGDRTDKRVALTIARIFEQIRVEPVVDLSAIEIDFTKSEKYIEAKKSFDRFVLFFCKKNPEATGSLSVHRFAQDVFTGLGKGPNGPSVLTSHIDALALKENPDLRQAIIDLNTAIGRDWVNDLLNGQILDFPKPKHPIHTGRIGISPEPAGKSRMFAIGDYWSQLSLLPIQKTLADALKFYKGDSTRDQQAGFNRILKETVGKPTYCFDLSSASDLIPAEMQVTRMKMVDLKAGDPWFKIMTQREFYMKAAGRNVRWTKGQPLGLLSSFPSFSLWHHDVVQLAAHLAFGHDAEKRYEQFTEYQLLGDDIVIWNHDVANKYLELMDAFGVPINKSKSIIGTEKSNQVEFAKRLAIRGVEMSSIKYNILSKNSMHFALSLIRLLHERDFIPTLSGYYDFTAISNQRESDFLNFCIWAAQPVVRGSDVTHSIRGPVLTVTRLQLDESIMETRVRRLLKKRLRLEKIKARGLRLVPLFKKSSIPYNETALGVTAEGLSNDYGRHPVYWAINQTLGDCGRALQLIMEDHSGRVLNPIEYLPFITEQDYFRTRLDVDVYVSQILGNFFRKQMKDFYRNIPSHG